METYDAIVIGGGPAGSTAARFLVRGGAKVAVIDRAEFPRVKLCAGWISSPIWDVLELAPSEYPAGLWPWQTCHVHYRGRDHAISCKGWFIRRYELDDYLLHRSGATLHLGINVKAIEKVGDLWQVGELRARHLIGAGGTHCPVARVLAPPRPRGVVGVQELEFPADPDAVARTRLGDADGVPELLLHDDLRGYAWNVPKRDWVNVGVGTIDPTEVRDAWARAKDHFVDHVPLREPLDHVKGHSYYLFDPAHLDGAYRDGALLVGDSLGLAQPLTAEGILPSTVSGRTAAEAILSGAPDSYPARLRAHPVIADYRRILTVRNWMSKRGGGAPRRGLLDRAVATGFAWMFSGARLPAPRLLDLALRRLA